ncbi:MAG: mismatch-specific glycosylase [Thermoleophilia bacterium]|nr:mismatch-specific glycosylase [Thermoleophilia bacterium]
MFDAPATTARPTARDLEAAVGGTLPDVIAPDLDVLLCGTNPSLWSAATGYNFARPGNRFWQALADAEFTDRQLAPHEQGQLLARGIGITNVCPRATRRADELTAGELRAGREVLAAKVARYRPRVLAVLGIVAYRAAFERPRAVFGLQAETLEAGAHPGDEPRGHPGSDRGSVPIWVLPNPSGLNAHFKRADLAHVFGELRAFVDAAR